MAIASHSQTLGSCLRSCVPSWLSYGFSPLRGRFWKQSFLQKGTLGLLDGHKGPRVKALSSKGQLGEN